MEKRGGAAVKSYSRKEKRPRLITLPLFFAAVPETPLTKRCFLTMSHRDACVCYLLNGRGIKRKRPRVPPGQPRPSTGAKPEDVSGTAPRFCAPIWILIFGNETAVRYAFPPVPKVGFFGAFCHFNTVQPAAAIKRTGRSHHTYRPVNDNAPSGFAIRRHMSPLSIPNY